MAQFAMDDIANCAISLNLFADKKLKIINLVTSREYTVVKIMKNRIIIIFHASNHHHHQTKQMISLLLVRCIL